MEVDVIQAVCFFKLDLLRNAFSWLTWDILFCVSMLRPSSSSAPRSNVFVIYSKHCSYSPYHLVHPVRRETSLKMLNQFAVCRGIPVFCVPILYWACWALETGFVLSLTQNQSALIIILHDFSVILYFKSFYVMLLFPFIVLTSTSIFHSITLSSFTLCFV